MRLTETLSAIAITLLASSENCAATSKTTTALNGLYAELYRVENGAVTDKMRVPLGNPDQYKKSDLKKMKNALKTNQEERAAANYPKIFDKIFNVIEKFVGIFEKSHRRLRIEGA